MYSGKERDSELAGSAMQGPDYFGAGYVSGAQGRFISVFPSYESEILEYTPKPGTATATSTTDPSA